MTRYYFITGEHGTPIARTKRAGEYHHRVFHGCGYYPGEDDANWQRPALSNRNRDPIHILRSGKCIPDVFFATAVDLIVSDAVRKEMETLKGVDFSPVVFERLAAISSPKLGVEEDWHDSFSTRTGHQRQIMFTDEYNPDHSLDYYRVICHTSGGLAGDFKFRKVYPITGSLYERSTTAPFFCPNAMEQFDVISSPWKVLSENAYAALAPFLQLDFFRVAVFDTEYPNSGIFYRGLRDIESNQLAFPSTDE